MFYNGRKAKDRSVNPVMMVSSLLTFFVMLGSLGDYYSTKNDNFDDGAGAVMSVAGQTGYLRSIKSKTSGRMFANCSGKNTVMTSVGSTWIAFCCQPVLQSAKAATHWPGAEMSS